MKDEQKNTEALKRIKEDVLALTLSPLYKYRTENSYFPVIGEGSHVADIMFVGEAPGRNEAKTGRPFCGAAGKVLDTLLESIGIKRPDIYITNIIKDRPQENRDPTTEEIAVYGTFLDRQIEIIQPKVIVALGRYSMGYIMEKFELRGEVKPISVLHGKVFSTKTSYGDISIVTLYHPAAAIYNQQLISTLKEDIKALKPFL